ncbi:unnamed protein product [Linum trigynum]|uniref:Uncharacterized protein n=1 Tax=Linum trigynum TaxID=586398 RepID=A0AAV2GDA0_9ROSI
MMNQLQPNEAILTAPTSVKTVVDLPEPSFQSLANASHTFAAQVDKAASNNNEEPNDDDAPLSTLTKMSKRKSVADMKSSKKENNSKKKK